MSVTIDITWQGEPKDLEEAAMRYLERVDERLGAAIDLITQTLEREARLNARWTDRTGEARAGLTATALSNLAARDIVRIYLFNTAPHAIYLELSRGGKYSVIMGTIERLLPRIQSILEGVLR